MSVSAISRYMPTPAPWHAGVAESAGEQEEVYLTRRSLHELEMAPNGDKNPKLFVQQHQRTVELASLAAREANGGFDFFM